jgi:hypothetical protein
MYSLYCPVLAPHSRDPRSDFCHRPSHWLTAYKLRTSESSFIYDFSHSNTFWQLHNTTPISLYQSVHIEIHCTCISVLVCSLPDKGLSVDLWQPTVLPSSPPQLPPPTSLSPLDATHHQHIECNRTIHQQMPKSHSFLIIAGITYNLSIAFWSIGLCNWTSPPSRIQTAPSAEALKQPQRTSR